jgi:release factor glutamine methyltransferase
MYHAPRTMTIAQALASARGRLIERDIESASLDAEVLLMHVLRLDRTSLYSRLTDSIPNEASGRFDALVDRRAHGEPVAYLTGNREFHGHTFSVSPEVLVPRPETEYLVEWTLRRSARWLDDRRRTVVDVGTGSGAVAISIAIGIGAGTRVIGSDVSLPALAVADDNRRRLGANVNLVAGSLLDWCGGMVDVITANLPYLRPDQAHDGIRFEPDIALYAGDDGFALNRTLIRQAKALLSSDGALIMEIDPAQRELASDTARAAFENAAVCVNADLAGLDRYLIVERT